jgi:iron(II)-dependent oxidoreductase
MSKSETSWSERAIPERLERLGFEGRRTRSGVTHIIPPMRLIPAGAFTMGSDASDPQVLDSERGQYSVQLDAFAIGTYPVTAAEYACAVAADAVPAPPDTRYPDHPFVMEAWRGQTLTWAVQTSQRADHPVVCVRWREARDYCRWLARVTGQRWRLPTEAEWEKAARWDVGATPPHARVYPWGDQWDGALANTNDGGPGMTTPVGSYVDGASPYGCQDLVGGAWEWTSTIWYDMPPYQRAKHEKARGNERVLRGGSWFDPPAYARAAYRDWLVWEDWGDWIAHWGFRLARG